MIFSQTIDKPQSVDRLGGVLLGGHLRNRHPQRERGTWGGRHETHMPVATRVLAGQKSQTLRLKYAGDYITRLPDRALTVFRQDGCPRWTVGRAYAVQRERCHPAEGRIEVTGLRLVVNPLAEVDEVFAKAEGMASVQEFMDVWRKLHKSEPNQPCWAIAFKLAGVDTSREFPSLASQI